MRAFVIDKPYMRDLTLNELMQNRLMNVALYTALDYNDKYYAIQDSFGNPLENITELVVTDKHKVPLWKQSMAMQMGKIPKSTTESRKIIRVKRIEPLNKKYEVCIATF